MVQSWGKEAANGSRKCFPGCRNTYAPYLVLRGDMVEGRRIDWVSMNAGGETGREAGRARRKKRSCYARRGWRWEACCGIRSQHRPALSFE